MGVSGGGGYGFTPNDFLLLNTWEEEDNGQSRKLALQGSLGHEDC